MNQIERALSDYLGEMCGMRLKPHALTGLAKAAIAAMQPAPQEPVAWLYTDRTNGRRMVSLDMRSIPACAETPLYAHPPAPQWQGIESASDAEITRLTEALRVVEERAKALREALFNATALIGHSVPMDTTAFVAGEQLTAQGVWIQGKAALAGAKP